MLGLSVFNFLLLFERIGSAVRKSKKFGYPVPISRLLSIQLACR